MEYQEDIISIVEVGGFNLEEVRRMGQEQMAAAELGLHRSCLKEIM